MKKIFYSHFKGILYSSIVLCTFSCATPIYRPIFNNNLEATTKGEVSLLGGISFDGGQASIAYCPINNFYIRAGYYSNLNNDRYQTASLGVGHNQKIYSKEELYLDLYNAIDFSKVKADRYGNNQNFEYQKLLGLKSETLSWSSGMKFSMPIFSNDVRLINKLGFRLLRLDIREVVLRLQAYDSALKDIKTFDGRYLIDLNYEFKIGYKQFSFINGINYGLYDRVDYLYPLELWTGVTMSIGGKKAKKNVE